MRTAFTGVLARFAASANWRGVRVAAPVAAALATISGGCGGGNSATVVAPAATPVYAGPGIAAISETGGVPAGYSLVWSDEFNVDGLPDSSKWSFDAPFAGASNHELQYYTEARPDNARVENGSLVIEARHEDLSPRNIRTGAASTTPRRAS